MVVMDHLCMLELQKCMHASMFVSTLDQVWDDMRVFLDPQVYIWDHTCVFEIHKWKCDVKFRQIPHKFR